MAARRERCRTVSVYTREGHPALLTAAVVVTGRRRVNVIVDMSTFPVALKLLVVLIGASAQSQDLCRARIAEWTEVPALDLVAGHSSIDREPVFAAAGEPTNTLAGAR